MWEYKVYTIGYYPNTPSVVLALNTYGSEGWELLSVIQDNDSGMYFYHFKRPKPKPIVDFV